MSKQRLDFSTFTQCLNELQRQVETTLKLAEGAAQPVELDQNKVGRLSRMDAMQGQAMAQANSQRQAVLLLEIERALAEIQTGAYGRCLACDELIASARLLADPVAQTCIACATRLEAG